MLDDLLAEAYARRVLSKKNPLGPSLDAAIQDDPNLRAEAQARLAAITDDMCKRDFISRIHRELLTKALS
jgi:hypothetical protein